MFDPSEASARVARRRAPGDCSACPFGGTKPDREDLTVPPLDPWRAGGEPAPPRPRVQRASTDGYYRVRAGVVPPVQSQA
jgi:hypothetical protein